jgi:hypothetical protein
VTATTGGWSVPMACSAAAGFAAWVRQRLSVEMATLDPLFDGQHSGALVELGAHRQRPTTGKTSARDRIPIAPGESRRFRPPLSLDESALNAHITAVVEARLVPGARRWA